MQIKTEENIASNGLSTYRFRESKISQVVSMFQMMSFGSISI